MERLPVKQKFSLFAVINNSLAPIGMILSLSMQALIESFALKNWWAKIPWDYIAVAFLIFAMGQLYANLTNPFSEFRIFLSARKRFANISWGYPSSPYGKEIEFLLSLEKNTNDVSCNLKISQIFNGELLRLENVSIFGNERYLQKGLKMKICTLKEGKILVDEVAIGPAVGFGIPYSYRFVFEIHSRGIKASESVFIVTQLKDGLFMAASMDDYLAEASPAQPSGMILENNGW